MRKSAEVMMPLQVICDHLKPSDMHLSFLGVMPLCDITDLACRLFFGDLCVAPEQAEATLVRGPVKIKWKHVEDLPCESVSSSS